jgi:hypothetical protein
MKEAYVWTFKEGLLSPLAHDLRLRVTQFDVGESQATFDAASLKVDWVSGALPSPFYGEIEQAIRKEVLKTAQFPKIVFTATEVSENEIRGDLTLCGVTRPIRCRRAGNQIDYELDQRDFGMKPYSAVLGTLKVKPVVKIQVKW